MVGKNNERSHPGITSELVRGLIYQNLILVRGFLAIACGYVLLQSLSLYLLHGNDAQYNFSHAYLSLEQIAFVLKEGSQWKYVSLLILPLLLLLKLFLIAILFQEGAFTFGLESTFKNFFLTAVKAEFVFLVPLFIKLVWFFYFQKTYDLDDLQFFSPLSVLSLYNRGEVDQFLAYPLHLLNIFEIVYWIVLAYQLRRTLNLSPTKSLLFVASTYGVGLLIWVLLITLLSIA
ncbi:hypothetical protein WSM22_12160 [Cytophagales bacterium WSM2-2]|nr:hypothetical protein WSM22_12160 [Cytophagales bacterium WSM2-2]